MGLDMYLNGKRFLSEYLHKGDDGIKQAVGQLFPELAAMQSGSDEGLVKQIEIEAGYWRKANQIHAWFVRNVQGGRDECQPHHVERDQLRELRDRCQRVLDNHALAEDLLPAQSGFFFGGTDYNEYYFQDLENTIKIIDKCLALPKDWSFEYCSSW